MRSGPPPLLPLLRSRVQGNLLALLYLHPDRDHSLTEAAALVGASVKTVHTEASRASPPAASMQTASYSKPAGTSYPRTRSAKLIRRADTRWSMTQPARR